MRTGVRVTTLITSVRAVVVITCALVASGVPQRLEAAPGAATVLPATLDAEGLSQILVRVTVDGHPFSCNLDSGGSRVLSVDRQKALDAGLVPTSSGSSAGVGTGIVRDQRVQDATVAVGAIVLPHITVVLVPRPSVAPDIECVFGLGLLADYVVQFDYASPVVRIFRPEAFEPPANGVPVPLTIDRVSNPYASARVRFPDGAEVTADLMVDTGAGYYSIVLLQPFVDANDVVRRVHRRLPRVADNPGLTIEATRLAALEVGPFDIQAPVAALIRNATAGSLRNGMIGNGFLRRFAVTFDYGRRQLWLEPNERLRSRDAFDTSGAEFRRNASGAYVVAAVSPDSPADDVRLRAGDVLLTIDGRTARDLSLGELQTLLSRRNVTCVLRVERADNVRAVKLQLRDRL